MNNSSLEENLDKILAGKRETFKSRTRGEVKSVGIIGFESLPALDSSVTLLRKKKQLLSNFSQNRTFWRGEKIKIITVIVKKERKKETLKCKMNKKIDIWKVYR